ncbi:restriction endonuclease subunit S [Neisseria lactamica]|uniref:restriction endonuclease subunit S n=1 Tax=Neisseria lactamica TaxID=486 RepID=UPI001EFE65EB
MYSTVRPNQEHYGFLENPSDNFIVSTGFSTIDVYDDNTDEKFIYYLLTQKHITDYLHTIGENSVSSYPSINPDDIANLKFTVPDLKTQQSIAAVLSALDKKIALNKQINARLEEMAKTLYDYWFVQFDFPDANGRPYKSSGGEMVFDETLKREIPKGWKPFKLSELVTLSTGKEDANFATEQGIYPFFTCSEKILKCDVYSFDTQAILLAGNGTFSVKRFTGKFNAYQRTYVLEPKSKNLYPIVYFVIIDNVIKFTSGSRGSIIKFITRGDIENIDIVLPNDIENMRFSEVLYTYLLQAELLEKQNHQLTQLRDFLLPMLMNGQVSVTCRGARDG